MTGTVTIDGIRVHTGGSSLDLGSLKRAGPWAHVWDYVDAVPDANGRLVGIPDPAGRLPMRRMPGLFPLLGASGDPLPGPLYIPSSARFNGRPAARFDHFTPTAGSPAFNLYAGMSPNISDSEVYGVENTANYFDPPNGYDQPYWVAVLGRLGSPDDPEGTDTDTAGIFDATHGGVGTGPTIGRKIVGLGQPNWQFSNFGPDLVLITVAHTATQDETVLIFCHVNGASSFLEVNWRGADGVLQTMRQTGTMLGWNYLECFAGWVHGQYLSFVAIAHGVPDEDDVDRVRDLAAHYIPSAGSLPEEP